MEKNTKVFFENYWHGAAIASLDIPVVRFNRNIFSIINIRFEIENKIGCGSDYRSRGQTGAGQNN